ncbi:hypothetical protein A2Y99_04265 [Candidatus Gottesmanbacteria bacterium RBG_13_37_7]|uniref:Uncharacterized protein n=1 Tax=Candidatus Gottesmanbacteria bacterium RBG_13_37_7 TaxID=1798369 RepID=A0A1F5YHC5_9BACT|nr:MAG: hypothetical protein A2Y99_04265 [Candidatus Gottesmanbacteria bacterium RBG_13_37_7]
MPYIAIDERKKLDILIDRLADQIVSQAKKSDNQGAFAGLLNYTCTNLALKIIKKQFGKMRYWLIAITVGTFQTVAGEFYRRVGIPYENKQIENKGDLKLYHDFSEQIKKTK